MRLSARLSAVLLCAALAVGACTGPGELGGPAVGGTLAARIGDAEITNADLEAETELWALNPEFLRLVNIADPGRPGARTTELTAFVLSHRVLSEQSRLLAASTGFDPSQEDVDQIIQLIDSNFSGPAGVSLFAVYPEDFRQRLGRDLAYQNNLQSLVGSSFTAPAVEISSRYGSVELLEGGLAQVIPPEGPRPEPLPPLDALLDAAGA